MALYLLKRISQFLVVVLGAVMLVFFLTQILGDPARLMLPLGTDQATVEEFRRQMGWTDPVAVQFLRFSTGAARMDLGESYSHRSPALGLVMERIPATVVLAGTAMAVSLVLGIPLGLLAAARQRSGLDRALTVFSFALISVADFWLGIMLILMFVIDIPLFKTSGYGLDLEHMVLPLVSLTARPLGRIIQLTRNTVLEEVSLHYVTAARAKGMSESRVLFVHVLRNALIPVIALSTYDFGRLFAGSGVVVESVFAWPGIGLLAIEALEMRDLPLIQATVLVAAVVVGSINLLVDLLYSVINPKVSLT